MPEPQAGARKGTACGGSLTFAGVLRAFQRKVFVGRGVREPGNETEARLGHARAHGVDEGELPDRCVDRPLVHYLLHLVQDCFAPGPIKLNRLLAVKCVDIGIGSIDEYAACNHLRLKAGRGVAEGARPGLDDVFEGLFGVGLEERDALNRPELGPDADRAETIYHRLADVGVRGIAIVVSGVEPFGMTSFAQQLLCLFTIVNRRGRLPEGFEIVANNRVSADKRMPKDERVVDAFAVNREARRTAHALIMPRRLRVPLLGKVEAERCLHDGGLEGQTRRLLHSRRQFTADGIGNIDLPPLEGSQARGFVGNDLEDEALHAWRFAPVLVEGLQDQLHAGREGDELVGSCANWGLLEAVIADLLDVSAGDDPPSRRGARVKGQKVWPRLFEPEADKAGTRDFDPGDTVLKQVARSATVALE